MKGVIYIELKPILQSVFEELFQEYEHLYSKLYFTFTKSGEDFVFTNICPELLDSIRQKPEDWIGKTVATASHIGDTLTREKLNHLYMLAWNQKKVLFYYFPNQNPDIFIITYLEPQYHYNQVIEVKGRCVLVSKKDIQLPLRHADQFLAF